METNTKWRVHDVIGIQSSVAGNMHRTKYGFYLEGVGSTEM
jgi:hypothetical protein